MKLSNKVLIGFFGFIFIYMTAAFTEIRFRGTQNINDVSNSIAETVDLTGVHYMVLEDLGLDIHVYGSEKPRIEVRSITGDLLRNLKYEVSGDTLKVIKLESHETQSVNISIYVSKSDLTGLTVNGAGVTIEGLEQKELYVFQNAGRINMYDNNKLDKLNLESFNKAYFMLNNTDLKALSVLIEQSEVHIDVAVKQFEGSMRDDSYLAVLSAEEIHFKKDESSKLDLNW